MSNPLQDFVPIAQHRAAQSHIYQSDEALRWQLRQHGPKFVEANALARIGRRLFVHPERFDTVVLEIGTKAAIRD